MKKNFIIIIVLAAILITIVVFKIGAYFFSKQLTSLYLDKLYTCETDNDCTLVNSQALDPKSSSYCAEACKYYIEYRGPKWIAVNKKFIEKEYGSAKPCPCAPPKKPENHTDNPVKAFAQCQESICRKVISSSDSVSYKELETKIIPMQNGSTTYYLVQYHYKGNVTGEKCILIQKYNWAKTYPYIQGRPPTYTVLCHYCSNESQGETYCSGLSPSKVGTNVEKVFYIKSPDGNGYLKYMYFE